MRAAFHSVGVDDPRQMLLQRAAREILRGDRLGPRRAAQNDGLLGDHAAPQNLRVREHPAHAQARRDDLIRD